MKALKWLLFSWCVVGIVSCDAGLVGVPIARTAFFHWLTGTMYVGVAALSVVGIAIAAEMTGLFDQQEESGGGNG